jgi:hypothetical protein
MATLIGSPAAMARFARSEAKWRSLRSYRERTETAAAGFSVATVGDGVGENSEICVRVQALRDFGQDSGTPLFLASAFRETHGFEKTAELRREDACLRGVVTREKITVSIVQENYCPEHLIRQNEGYRQHRASLEFGGHGVARSIEPVDVNRLFLEDGFIRNCALVGSQACTAELSGHPTIAFNANQLIGRQELPHIGGAYLKVVSGFAAEEFQDFCGRIGLGRSR